MPPNQSLSRSPLPQKIPPPLPSYSSPKHRNHPWVITLFSILQAPINKPCGLLPKICPKATYGSLSQSLLIPPESPSPLTWITGILTPRDQIANIHQIVKKAREFQKNIYCCIDYAKAFVGSIKDRNGRDLTEVEDIKKRWQEYTEELYKKDLRTQIITMVWSLTIT